APLETATDTLNVIPGLVISNPISGSRAGSQSSSSSLNEQEDALAFVSMPPGALVGALTVRVRNVTTNSASTLPVRVIDGGFDPIAVGAHAGDRLALIIAPETGLVTVSYFLVPVRRPPKIVRTSPTKGRTDVALNARPRIVFSEPIEARTLSNATV